MCTPADRGEIVVFSHVKMRLGFISIVNLQCTPADPGEILCFSCKIRLGFILTTNLHVIPADCGEIVVFSHVKCACVSF